MGRAKRSAWSRSQPGLCHQLAVVRYKSRCLKAVHNVTTYTTSYRNITIGPPISGRGTRELRARKIQLPL